MCAAWTGGDCAGDACEWERISLDMPVMVIPFLGVQDIMSLNSAISDKRLRKQLKKSYRGAVIPAFDQYRFTRMGLRGSSVGD